MAAATVLLLAGACTSSRVDPKADIDVSGAVQRQGGKPVGGARLALTREGDAGDVILTVASLGFACLDRKQSPAICDDARFASTSSNGTFNYRLTGKDTQSTFGYSAVLSITTGLAPKSDEAAGSSTTYRFHVQTEKLDLPIRLWEPKVAVRTGSFGARVSFPKLPAGLLPSSVSRGGPRYTIEFVRGGEIVWRLSDARPVTVFDPRLLEDSTGTMRVVAFASDLHVPERLGDEVAFALRGGARQYESPLDAPVSRGKPCGVADERGVRYPVSPCVLTDGTFTEGFDPAVCGGATGCVEPRHVSAFVDLGTRVPVSLVVVRGCKVSCRVETSSDAKTWRLVGVAQADRAAFPSAPARAARYVRMSGSPGAIDPLTEISVWSGRPQLPDGSLLVAPGSFPTSPGATPGGAQAARDLGRKGFNVWALVAASILSAAAGALTAVLVRRRRAA